VKEYKDTVGGYSTSKTYQELQTEHYPLKPYEFSSHTQVSQIIRKVGKNILDIGCGSGAIEEMADFENHSFIGVDYVGPQRNKDKFKDFIIRDLDYGLPISKLKGQRFDYILLLDILEHLVNPTKILQDVHQIIGPDTKVIISVPNIANIYVRFSLLFGRFEYTNRGILDKTHLRFFTRASLKRWVEDNDFVIKKQLYTIIPLNEVVKQRESNLLLKIINHLLYFCTSIFSGLLAYQLILIVKKK
jgi:2-polyprenyl-3-methyl-5-hydroxy-6-metoxy-1,4-benzoquinol methylase